MKFGQELMSDRRQKVLDEFLKIVQIDSLSLQEQNMFSYIKSRLFNNPSIGFYFEPYTLKTTGQTSGNLVVRMLANSNQKKSSVFFDAHVDTVEPGIGIKPIVKDGFVYSSGDTVLGADDKAGVAAMLIAIDELSLNLIEHGDIYFIFSSAEEIGLMGVNHLDIQKIKSDYGFVLDAHGSVGTIIIGAPDHYHYTYQIKGLASHAGIEPEKGVNAIKLAASVLLDLPQGRFSDNTVCNVGFIEGGKAHNIVADECLIKGEFRSHSKDESQAFIKLLKEIREKHLDKTKGIDLKIEEIYKGFKFSENSEIIELAKKSIKKIGLNPITTLSGGGSNTNIYNQRGINAITLGVGMENVHSSNERIAVKDLGDLLELILSIVQEEK